MQAELSQTGQTLSKLLPSLLKKTAERAAIEFYTAIEDQFDEGQSASAFRSRAFVDRRGSKRLGLRSGALSRSFIKNQRGNIFELKNSTNGVVMRIGTQIVYARIHEYGGFIASKGRMHRYFWAMHAKTGEEAWKFMAIAAKRDGGIHMPARPFFAPALRDFGKNRIPALQLSFAKDVQTAWDAL